MNASKFGGYLLANLLVCLWIGWLLDDWTGKRPLFMIILVIYAIVGSFFVLIWRNRRKEKEKENGKRSD